MHNSTFHCKPWVAACIAGELLGIGCAAALARLHWLFLGEAETVPQKIRLLLVMLLAGALEGSLLGYFQWKVLRGYFPTLKVKKWVGATALVAMSGWFLGMIPSLTLSAGEANPVAEPAPLNMAALVIGGGLLVGALFGLAQWWVLKQYASC